MSAEFLPLWGGYRIPIILLSGEVNSGKSMFGLLIDAACRQSDHPPTVRAWDQEGSMESYHGSLNFDWRDTRDAVMQGVHRVVLQPGEDDPKWRKILLSKADVNDSPSASLFRAWYLSLLKVERGQYRIGIVDTWTPLQEGMIEWLKMHPDAFGRSANQYDKASSMFLWPDVKSIMSYILATDCRLRFETFVLTVHLKNEWAGGSKTGQRIAEGLDVLDKLATLHLRLDRTPKAKGKDAPRVPVGIVLKERLIHFGATPGDDRPILPPRLAECTPDAIRAYIAKGGADFSDLAASERAPDLSLTEDQIRQMDAVKASDERAAAEATLEAEKIRVSRMDMMRQAAAGSQLSQVSSTETPTVGAASSVTAASSAEVAPRLATQQQLGDLAGVMKKCFATGQDAIKWVHDRYSKMNPTELTEDQVADAFAALSEKIKADAAAKLAATEKPATATAPSTNGDGGYSTDDQRATIKRLSDQLGATDEQHKALLAGRWKVQSYRSLTVQQAAERIIELEKLTTAPVNEDADAPF